MANTGGLLDTYLIAQALGWEWNIWTIIILTLGIPLLLISIGFIVWIIGIYFRWW